MSNRRGQRRDDATLADLANLTGMHRARNARLEVDYLSRGLEPRWQMVRVDGTWYDRRALAEWLVAHGGQTPTRRWTVPPEDVEDVTDPAPYRIAGKAPLLPGDVY